MQEGLVPFNIGVSVVGDIAIGVWFGHQNLGQRIHGRPSLSYAFHTAFLSAETMRVSLPSLDISNKRLFPADKATNFFMDVTLEDTDGAPTAEYALNLTCAAQATAPHTAHIQAYLLTGSTKSNA